MTWDPALGPMAARVPRTQAAGRIHFLSLRWCTSNTTWTKGNKGSDDMNPGMACIACHAISDDGPLFALAGTLYPSAHEPDLCNGLNGSGASSAQIVVTGADGNVVTLAPNVAGNFSYEGALAKPFTAKVTYMGKERAMATAQTSGDWQFLPHAGGGQFCSGAYHHSMTGSRRMVYVGWARRHPSPTRLVSPASI